MYLELILLGVIIPIMFALIHTIIGVYLIYTKGNVTALGWNMLGFLTKTVFMLFMTYMGVSVLEFDFRIYVPLLTFFWFFTHIVEAFVIQHYIKVNDNMRKLIDSVG